MRLPEQKAWDLLKEHFPGDISRVENTVDAGTPDITGAYAGIDYWVELKANDSNTVITDIIPTLRPAQVVWHRRRAKQGSLIYVILKQKNSIDVYRCNNRGEYLVVFILEKIKNKFNWAQFDFQFKESLMEDRDFF